MKWTIVLVLLFLVSCSGASEEQGETSVFIGGFEGIRAYALEGAPPSVITDSATFPFSIILGLENVGEVSVGNNTINPLVVARLAGIQPVDFSLEREDTVRVLNQRLDGTRKLYEGSIISGEMTTLSFENLLFKPRLISEELFTPVIELCYDYATLSNIQVCMKDDILESYQDDTLCSLRNDLDVRNTGGPIHVVEADQNPVGDNRIQVNFVVQNIGNGVPFSRKENNASLACSFSLDSKDVYKVLVAVSPVDNENYGIDCKGLDEEEEEDKDHFASVFKPEGYEWGIIRLRENAPKSITCFLEKKHDIEGRVFQEMMDVRLYYRYGEFLEIPMLIQEARGLDAQKD